MGSIVAYELAAAGVGKLVLAHAGNIKHRQTGKVTEIDHFGGRGVVVGQTVQGVVDQQQCFGRFARREFEFIEWDLPPVAAMIRQVIQNKPPIYLPPAPSAGKRCTNPLLATHIGPPWGLSGSSVFRYIIDSVTSVSFVAMPRKPIIHIQNTAPGPPSEIAIATPPMLPSPTVADSAVESA